MSSAVAGGGATLDQVKAKAPVPAYCDMPAQTLTGGQTDASLKPKHGELVTDGAAPLQLDTDQDGTQEVVVRYLCSAGPPPRPSGGTGAA